MRQEITEDEIEKILERLAYGNQTDLLAQKLYFNETEAIQQNRIKDNRVIDALKIITSNAPSSSARKEASKTLDYLETERGRTRVGRLVGIAPLTTFFAIFIWHGSVISCFGSATELSSYCQKVFGSLGDGLGVIVATNLFLVVGLTVSTMLGAVVSWLFGRVWQTMSRGVIITAEFVVGLVIGTVPFLLVMFGSH